MTPKEVKRIAKREAANVYGSIYADNLQKIARQAFLDGMVFWEMVKSGAVTKDMIDEDFFAILRERVTDKPKAMKAIVKFNKKLVDVDCIGDFSDGKLYKDKNDGKVYPEDVLEFKEYYGG